MAKAATAVPFPTIEAAPDVRTLCERIGDVLSESHREDTPEEYRLGLLQGALAVGLPQLLALEARASARRRVNSKRRRSRA